MSKLAREQKIEIYQKRKSGVSIQKLALEYNMTKKNINYLVRLLDLHGENILRKDKNIYYPPSLKEEIINKVLIDQHSIQSTALEYGMSSDGMLHTWIKSYKENGYVIVEKKRGRLPTMTKNVTSSKDYKKMTPEEKVIYLENKNFYLEAEVEYLKKLRAVVQARKNRQPKKK